MPWKEIFFKRLPRNYDYTIFVDEKGQLISTYAFLQGLNSLFEYDPDSSMNRILDFMSEEAK